MVNAKKLEPFIGYCDNCHERLYLDTMIKKSIVKFECSECSLQYDKEEDANFCCTDEQKLKRLKRIEKTQNFLILELEEKKIICEITRID